MINCYISQIQTRTQRVSLSTSEFSSPAVFGFQVHKRAVYVLLEILSGPYCLISIQNVSAQYHFCHIVYGTLISPKTFFFLEMATFSDCDAKHIRPFCISLCANPVFGVFSTSTCSSFVFHVVEYTPRMRNLLRCHDRRKLLMRIISLWQLWLRRCVRSEFNYWLNCKV